MVPNLIWAPDFFGPQEIWAPRTLVPKKYRPRENWSLNENHHLAFSCWGTNFWGPKILGAQISWSPKKSGDQMRSGAISVIASNPPSQCLIQGHCAA